MIPDDPVTPAPSVRLRPAVPAPRPIPEISAQADPATGPPAGTTATSPPAGSAATSPPAGSAATSPPIGSAAATGPPVADVAPDEATPPAPDPSDTDPTGTMPTTSVTHDIATPAPSPTEESERGAIPVLDAPIGSDAGSQPDPSTGGSPDETTAADKEPAPLAESAPPIEAVHPNDDPAQPSETDQPADSDHEGAPGKTEPLDAPVSAASVGGGPTPDDPAPDDPASDDPASDDLPIGDESGEEISAELEAQASAPQATPQRPDNGEWRGIVLVTGTDTDVGKTIVTAAVTAAAQASGLRVAVIKPGQTGTVTGAPTDIEVVARLAAPETTRVLAEYPEPMAPLAAATVAQLAPLELYEVVDAIRAEAESHDLVLVEGAGGLLVPMGVRPSGEAWTVADLALTLGVKTIVVARAGLGTLNHTALTLEALNRRGVPAGVVIGAWPPDPELVHWANLSELAPHLIGALPDGAGSMDPGVFRRSAPGWLTPPLYGVIENWRVWAEETDGH